MPLGTPAQLDSDLVARKARVVEVLMLLDAFGGKLDLAVLAGCRGTECWIVCVIVYHEMAGVVEGESAGLAHRRYGALRVVKLEVDLECLLWSEDALAPCKSASHARWWAVRVVALNDALDMLLHALLDILVDGQDSGNQLWSLNSTASSRTACCVRQCTRACSVGKPSSGGRRRCECTRAP